MSNATKAAVLALAMSTWGCGDGSAPSDEQGAGQAPGGSAETGGMDSAGSFVLGLKSAGVFIQPLWQGDRISYVVLNQRSEAVTLDLFHECDALPCAPTAALMTWQVPAGATQTFEGDLLLDDPELLAIDVKVGNQRLGFMLPPSRPLPASANVVVSNQAFGKPTFPRSELSFANPQLETTFISPPGASFSATLTLPGSGKLWPFANVEAHEGATTLKPIAVRTLAPTTTDGNGHMVIEVVSEPDSPPTQVELDYELPSELPGTAPLVLSAGQFVVPPFPPVDFESTGDVLRVVPRSP